MKSRSLLIYLYCATAYPFVGSAALAQMEPQFVKASQEYAAGHFKEAIDGYEALVRKGAWSANLFYDLGNSYFHTGDLGHAILNYERALALDRHHPEAQANLRIVRDEARALEINAVGGERFAHFADAGQYAIAAAITFWLAFFSIIWWIFSQRRSSVVSGLSILCLSIFAFAVLSIFWIENGNKGRALAVVTENDVEARLATADNARSVLALPPGSEIRILSKRGDWIYAALPNDLRGWIPARSAENVRL
jgi:tetratricopeptide (TPR) repeat protein